MAVAGQCPPAFKAPCLLYQLDASHDQSLTGDSWQLYHCPALNRFLKWCHGHVPGVDDFTAVLFALRHIDLDLGWLVPPKVGQIVVVRLPNARELGPGGEQTVYGVKTCGRTVFEDAPEE